jgi:hypothetical protein
MQEFCSNKFLVKGSIGESVYAIPVETLCGAHNLRATALKHEIY